MFLYVVVEPRALKLKGSIGVQTYVDYGKIRGFFLFLKQQKKSSKLVKSYNFPIKVCLDRTPVCDCGSAAIAARGQVAGEFQKSQ